MSESTQSEIERYIDKPRSWLAERLVEADRVEKLNLKEIAKLAKIRDTLGEELMREKCRVEELEAEIERPEPGTSAQRESLCVTAGGVVLGFAVYGFWMAANAWGWVN
jgi:pilus assembly protein TadC